MKRLYKVTVAMAHTYYIEAEDERQAAVSAWPMFFTGVDNTEFDYDEETLVITDEKSINTIKSRYRVYEGSDIYDE